LFQQAGTGLDRGKNRPFKARYARDTPRIVCTSQKPLQKPSAKKQAQKNTKKQKQQKSKVFQYSAQVPKILFLGAENNIP